MLRRLIVRLAVLTAVGVWLSAPAEAQLFGSRSFGSPLSRRSRPGVGEPGVLSGNERFVRGNRRQTDFVGTDSRTATGFVGAREGTNRGRVRAAAATVRERSRPNVNTPRRQPGNNDLYEPKLTVGFDFAQLPAESIRANLRRRLGGGPANNRSPAAMSDVGVREQEESNSHPSSAVNPVAASPNRQSDGSAADSASRHSARFGRIEVSVEGRTARLQGTVASADDRDLAALIALFEPGISDVQNDVIVQP